MRAAVSKYRAIIVERTITKSYEEPSLAFNNPLLRDHTVLVVPLLAKWLERDRVYMNASFVSNLGSLADLSVGKMSSSRVQLRISHGGQVASCWHATYNYIRVAATGDA